MANIRLADGGVLGDNPAVIKIFAELGRLMGQKGQIKTDDREAFSMMSPRDAKSKKILLMEDQKFVDAYLSEDNPRHAEAVRQMGDLSRAEVGGT